jgi:hypothetical protein
MRRLPSFFSVTGLVAAAIVFAAAGAATHLVGPGIFSPGGLNAQTSSELGRDPAAAPVSLGGVTSHAELGQDCGACHPAPWGARTSADACLDCHEAVAAELEARTGLHGGLAGANGALACGPCHPEHDGPTGALTVVDGAAFREAHESTGFSLASHRETARGDSFACADCHPAGYEDFRLGACSDCHREIDMAFVDRHQATYGEDCLGCHDGTGRIGVGFDHDATGFPLETGHAEVACVDCHDGAGSAQELRQTPTDCITCHAGDDAHEGAYGRGCGECHAAATWEDVTFDHAVFPLDHGSEERRATCETCHPASTRAYTCYGCHEHTRANVRDKHEGRALAELVDCVRCHPGGREADEGD